MITTTTVIRKDYFNNLDFTVVIVLMIVTL